MISRLKSIFISIDFIPSLLLAIVIYWVLPLNVSNQFSKDIYGVGISVLSIIFSVYFAALSVIISSSDDDFVKFLDQIGKYKNIIFAFRFSLLILFASLLISIFMYAIASIQIEMKIPTQNKYLFCIFTFSFFYGLFTALNATLDSIKYALTRIKFINSKSRSHQSDSNTPSS